MNVLVTGGAGFIGSNFVRQRLLENGPPLPGCPASGLGHIVVLDALMGRVNSSQRPEFASDLRYVFVQGSTCDAAAVARALADYAIDAVVDLAVTLPDQDGIDATEAILRGNVLATARLLEAVRQHWSALPEARRREFRMVHVSSDAIYGPLDSGERPFVESSPFKPRSPLAAAKAASIHVVNAVHAMCGLPVVTVVAPNAYGPCQPPDKLIPATLLRALRGQPLMVPGDGRQIRDWLHADDLAAALWLALQTGRPGETYHVSGTNEQRLIDVVRLVATLLDLRAPRADGRSHARQIAHAGASAEFGQRRALDGGKLLRDLGWRPRESFAAGLEKTIDWYLTHRGWLEQPAAGGFAPDRDTPGVVARGTKTIAAPAPDPCTHDTPLPFASSPSAT